MTRRTPATSGQVYILVLNFNSWGDTLECLEAVFRLRYSSYRVIVVDNGSSDDSAARIQDWAAGRLDALAARAHRHLIFPPVPKPVPLSRISPTEAHTPEALAHDTSGMILIETGENRGYAAGNNIGLRYALAQKDCTHVWLLNADTLATSDSLSQLLAVANEHPDIGMCGSTLLYYADPDTIHALGGGRYWKWLALVQLSGKRRHFSDKVEEKSRSRPLSMVSGASMLVTRRFLREVGPMCEDYFLYFEELDWAVRAAGRFSLTYAPRSIVYHKGGFPSGRANQRGAGNLQARYFLARSRLLFTRKHHPYTITTVRLAMVAEALAWLAIGQARLARVMLKLALGPSPVAGGPLPHDMEYPVRR